MSDEGKKDIDEANELKALGYTHGMRAEHAIDGVAVHVLCRPTGCPGGADDPKDPDFKCPFEPMCAADLIPESQRRLVEERFTLMSAVIDIARDLPIGSEDFQRALHDLDAHCAPRGNKGHWLEPVDEVSDAGKLEGGVSDSSDGTSGGGR